MIHVCNHDCFNCQYEDCIFDGITSAEKKEIEARDSKRTEKQREYNNRYQKAFYQRNKERLNAKRMERYRNNREVEIERAKAYYWNNYEEVRAKQKIYDAKRRGKEV